MIRTTLLKTVLFAALAFIPVGYTAPADDAVCGEGGNERIEATLRLALQVGAEPLRQALEGYARIAPVRAGIITLLDLSKPSDQERLFVLDIERGQVLFRSLCSHGRGSGERYATRFSNDEGSHCSSLGFFLTGGTYTGSNGYSLYLDGLEEGINDHARSRAIVMHGADYCSPLVAAGGRLGRSFGCPAVPREISRPIIDCIKGGTLFFIYAGDEHYASSSPVLTGKG